MKKPAIPWPLRFRRSAMRFVFRQIFRLTYRIRIEGQANIPVEGAYLIAHNHVSVVDPSVILAFWPISVQAIGAAELWQRPGQNWLVQFYGTLPVNRGEMDRQFIEGAVEVLRGGLPLLIAPEGTRSRTPGMNRANPGIAYLVDRAEVPVLPVAVTGNTVENLKLAVKGKRPPLDVRIGKLFHLPPLEGQGAARREARQRNADLVLEHVAALLPETYQGFYARSDVPSQTP
ncbi:MAG: 1-acyl-sn-glycerol-3-phosphate acyltransferase [Anaerolineales bacterium]|nr:1-acyl-sn-glycerol-3-phosphate acyltransferase [Anaerolineales bacterium]